MKEVKDYSQLLPTKPPEDMGNWLYNTVDVPEYIVYRADWYTDPLTGIKKKGVKCVCTSCGCKFIMNHVKTDACGARYSTAPFGYEDIGTNMTIISGDNTVCPSCGNVVTAIHIVSISEHMPRKIYYPVTIERIDNALAIIAWAAEYMLYKDGYTRFCILPYEAYVFDDAGQYRLAAWKSGCYGGKTLTGHWAQRKAFKDLYGGCIKELIYPWDGSIMNGTIVENSKLDIYLANSDVVYPVTYLRLYRKHNNVENIITSGGSILMSSIIRKDCCNSYTDRIESYTKIKRINYKKNKPHEMLGLSKTDYKYAVAHEFSINDIEYYKAASQYGVGIDDVEQCMRNISLVRVEEMKELNIGVNIMKTVRYLEKQTRKYKEDTTDSGILLDYWKMAIDLNMDIYDDDVRYPQRLLAAHDTVTDRHKVEENRILNEKISARYEELDKYHYEAHGLEIHPARSQKEFFDEGQLLHHCVARYAKDHANGKTAIFFIRHTDMPDVPYFTLELDERNMKVLQNRGSHNCARTTEVIEFEAEWLKYIKEVKNGKRSNRVKVVA